MLNAFLKLASILFVVLTIVHADDYTVGTMKIRVLADERIVLYVDYLKQLVASRKDWIDTKFKDKAIVSSFLKSAKLFERLAEKLDQAFRSHMKSDLEDYVSCDLKDLVMNACQQKVEAKKSAKPIECTKDLYFRALLRYLYIVHQETLRPKNLSQKCIMIMVDVSDDEHSQNLWAVKALMHEEFQRITGTYIKGLEKVMQHLIDDESYIQRVFLTEPKPIELDDYSPADSDVHKTDGIVAVLTLIAKTTKKTPPFKIVYKPSSVLIDWLITGKVKDQCSGIKVDVNDKLYTLCNLARIESPNIEKYLSTDANDPEDKRSFHNLILNIRQAYKTPVEEREVKSIFEMLNDSESNEKLRIPTYKILPIESLPSSNQNKANEPAKTLDFDSEKETNEHMLDRLGSSHGYAEFLDSHCAVAVDPHKIIIEAKSQDKRNLSMQLDEKLKQQIWDKDAWFTKDDMKNYSVIIGKILEVVKLLLSTDFHEENLIVKDKKPHIIDLENTFNPTSTSHVLNVAKGEKGALHPTIYSTTVSLNLLFYNEQTKRMAFLNDLESVRVGKPMKLILATSPNANDVVDKAKGIQAYQLEKYCFLFENSETSGSDFVKQVFSLGQQTPNLKPRGSATDKLLRWIGSNIMDFVIVREVVISTSILDNAKQIAQLENSNRSFLLKKAVQLMQTAIRPLMENNGDNVFKEAGTSSLNIDNVNEMARSLAVTGLKLFEFISKKSSYLDTCKEEETLRKISIFFIRRISNILSRISENIKKAIDKGSKPKIESNPLLKLITELNRMIAELERTLWSDYAFAGLEFRPIRNIMEDIFNLLQIFQLFANGSSVSVSSLIPFKQLYDNFAIASCNDSIQHFKTLFQDVNQEFPGLNFSCKTVKGKAIFGSDQFKNMNKFLTKIETGYQFSKKRICYFKRPGSFFELLPLLNAFQESKSQSTQTNQPKLNTLQLSEAEKQIISILMFGVMQSLKPLADLEELRSIELQMKLNIDQKGTEQLESGNLPFKDLIELSQNFQPFHQFKIKAEILKTNLMIRMFRRGLSIYSQAERIKKNTLLVILDYLYCNLNFDDSKSNKIRVKLGASNFLDKIMLGVIPSYYTLAKSKFLYETSGVNAFNDQIEYNFSKLIQKDTALLQKIETCDKKPNCSETIKKLKTVYDAVTTMEMKDGDYYNISPFENILDNIQSLIDPSKANKSADTKFVSKLESLNKVCVDSKSVSYGTDSENESDSEENFIKAMISDKKKGSQVLKTSLETFTEAKPKIFWNSIFEEFERNVSSEKESDMKLTCGDESSGSNSSDKYFQSQEGSSSTGLVKKNDLKHA